MDTQEQISALTQGIESLEGILVGRTDQPDKPGLLERIRKIEKVQEDDLENRDARKKSNQNLKNKIYGAVLVTIVLAIMNFIFTFGAKISNYLTTP